MLRGVLFIGLFLISFYGQAQSILYARASGAWNNNLTVWSLDGVTPCSCSPTSADDVFTNGRLITVPSGSFSVNNLYITDNVAGGLSKSGLGSATITIFGTLGSYTGPLFVESYSIPTVPTITTARLTFVFNGSVPASGSIIEAGAWGPLAPLPNLTYSPISLGTPLSIDSDIAMGAGTQLLVSAGTLDINGNLQSATASATISVNSGASLRVSSGSISGNGTNSTKFPTLTINGTVTSQSNTTSFINADVVNLNSGGIFNVGYNNGVNQEGWWYTGAVPSSPNIDVASTVNYNSSTSQNVYPLGYGNLTLGGTGLITKTVSGSGSVNIKGNLSFANTSITFTAPAANQVIFDGTTSPSNLTGAQSINGSGTANFNGGLQLNKAAGTLTLGQDISIQNGLTLTSGTIDFGSNTVNLAGNLSNSASLTAAASTLNITGTTSITGVTTTLNNLTVTGTGNFTAPATLNLTGNFTNNGAFNASTGNLVFNGSAPQTIGGSTNTSFYDITTNNAVSITSSQSISGILSISSGTFTANGNLTLLSTASGDAMIGPIGGGTLSGNVIVQRYLPNGSGSRAYRYLASPVFGANVAQWQTWFPITGTFTNPSTQAEWPSISGLVQSSPSLFYYNESKGGAVGARYDSYPPNGSSSSGTLLNNGTGYAAFIRQTSPPVTISVTGSVRQGNNVSVGVTNKAGDPTDDGWNLIGNPFPAPIKWDNVTKPTGLSASALIKDNTGIFTTAGNYVTFAGGTSVPSGLTDIIPSGEAFLVRYTTSSSSTNIVFKEADKLTIAAARNPTFLRQETISNIIRAKLTGNGKQDELAIRLVEGALDKADNNFDGFKFKNDFLSFSSLSSDGQKMAINAASPLTTTYQRKSFPLVIEGNGSWAPVGNFKISFSEFETFSGVIITLKDIYLKDSIEVSANQSEYSFTSTADTKTFANRFELSIARPAVITSVEDLSPLNQINVYPNPTNGTFDVELPKNFNGFVKALNNLGQEIGIINLNKEGERLKGNFDLTPQSAGIYFVQVSDGSKVYTKKVIKK